jgi:glycosyltransferase involved in cell wall biosynthesis
VKLLAVHVANGFSPEARVLATLLGYRRAMDVRVLHHDWPGDRVSAERMAQAAHAPVTRLDFGWRPPPSPLPRKILSRLQFQLSRTAARRAAAAFAPDVVISSQQVWDCTAATYIANALHIPQVIQLHYSVGWWLGKLPLARLKTCDHVIAISDFIARQAIDSGVAPGRVTTIKNSMLPLAPPDAESRLRLRSELGVAADARIIGFVARLDAFKGHAEAIDAFARVAPQRADLHLVIAGRGELESALRQQASASGVGERIRFLGYRTDVPRLLAGFDVFVHPSFNEPFGLSVLEAEAAGLPVVAFRSGATDEIVCHGETGLLAAEGDVVELADRLTQLVDDASLRQRMGAAARERVMRDFNPPDAAAHFETLIDAVAHR